ncbi:MAG: AAA family ATPase [Myxococcota bacterium]
MNTLSPAGPVSGEIPFLRRVRLRNYKSIAQCDVELGRFTVLVGRNGAGKSNFLDALRFVADGLNSSLDHAIRERAGIDAVRRRSTEHPHNFQIELLIWLTESGQFVRYGFEISAQRWRQHRQCGRPSIA